MSNLHIGATWGPRTTSFDLLARQSLDFASRLRSIHPVFAEISCLKGRTYASMMKQPLVWRLEDADWHKVFEASQARNIYFTSVTYWNRRLADNEGCTYTIHANNTGSMGNGVVVNNVPVSLNNADNLKAMLKAEIEVFDADQGEVWTAWPGHVEDPIVLFWHWLLWIRDGQPWPSGSDSRFNQAQGQPSSAEPWLGGRLYAWAEYEPWRLGPGPDEHA